MSDETGEAIRAALLARYLADEREGEAQDVSSYQALFPGYEELVAAEIAAMSSPGSVTTVPNERRPSVAGRRFGPYVVLEEIGAGGQASVYRARGEDGREVALKVMRAAALVSFNEMERFRREAEILRSLDHPAVCPVYDVGESELGAWMAMELVEGVTLQEMIRRQCAVGEEEETASMAFVDLEGGDDVPTEGRAERTTSGPGTQSEIARILRIFEQVARALHVAHEAGIVHRDVKPGNVMVRDDGSPVILDFGLARDTFADGPSLTETGDLAGTPAYMSPEQLTAKRIDLDNRSDIFSLGVTLYECLTLERPFKAESRAELYQAILSKYPTEVHRLNDRLPRAVSAVVSRAIEKDRDRRYATAEELADDLRRVREEVPTVARPTAMVRRWGRRARQRPVAVTVAAALAILVPLGLLYVTDQFTKRKQQQNQEKMATAFEAFTRVIVAAAQRQPPETDDRERLLEYLGEADLAFILDNPGSPDAVTRFRNALAAKLRSAVDVRLRHPRGTVPIVGDFVVTGLEAGGGRRYRIALRDPVHGTTWDYELDPTGETWAPPADLELSSAGEAVEWEWRVFAHDVQDPERRQTWSSGWVHFRVTSSEEVERIKALVKTGDATLDVLLRAYALAREGYSELVVESLRDVRFDGPEVERARKLLLSRALERMGELGEAKKVWGE